MTNDDTPHDRQVEIWRAAFDALVDAWRSENPTMALGDAEYLAHVVIGLRSLKVGSGLIERIRGVRAAGRFDWQLCEGRIRDTVSEVACDCARADFNLATARSN